MAWITTIPHDAATGTLRDAYDWQAARLGEPTEFTQLGSLYPELVLERLRLYKVSEAAPSGLSHLERLLAALVTSNLNGTVHCASGLRVRLAEIGIAPAAIAQVDAAPADAERIAAAVGPSVAWGKANGDRPAATQPRAVSRERLSAVLAYAALLTRTPATIELAHVERLRAAGLTDLEILDLNNLVAYYNYINRVANGLGLHTPIEQRSHALAAMPR